MKRDNLGQTFHVATTKAPCRNMPGFAKHAVKTAHESRAVYNACIRILVEADDEDIPLRSRDGYEKPSLQEALLELRTRTPWIEDISSNIRRSAAAQAHTAFGRWLEAQRINGRKLAKASDLRQKRRKALHDTAQLRRTHPAEYHRTRKQTLKNVGEMRRTAAKLTAKVERYTRRDRDPLHMTRRRKHAERDQRLTFPLIAGEIRILDNSRTQLRVHGFGDLELKRPLPDGMEPVSLTLVARRKRRHRRSRVQLEQLEWSAHLQYRRHVDQKPVTAESSSVGVDPGVKHAATTQDDQGRITHHHYTGTVLEERQRRLQNLRRRRADCTRRSRRWRAYNHEIRRTSNRLTNLRNHQTLQMANATVDENAIVGIEDFQANNARRSARGTHDAPGTNVQAKRGLSRALDYSRPGELKQELKRACERRGAVWSLIPREEYKPTLRPVRLHGQGTPREPSDVPMPKLRPHRQRRRQRRREHTARSRQMATRQNRTAEGSSKGGGVHRSPQSAEAGCQSVAAARRTPRHSDRHAANDHDDAQEARPTADAGYTLIRRQVSLFWTQREMAKRKASTARYSELNQTAHFQPRPPGP